MLEQSKPGDWDVVVMDETDTQRLAQMGVLAPLNAHDYPLSEMPSAIADAKLTSLKAQLRD